MIISKCVEVIVLKRNVGFNSTFRSVCSDCFWRKLDSDAACCSSKVLKSCSYTTTNLKYSTHSYSFTALAKLDGELSGKYYSLQTLGEADKQQLIDDHFLFERPISRHFTSGGMARDFPDGRGIW